MSHQFATPRRPGPLRPSFGNTLGLRQNISTHNNNNSNNANINDYGLPSPADGPLRDPSTKSAQITVTADDFGMSRSFSGASTSYDQENTVAVGDAVEVPGGIFGVARYVGTVKGKAGVFAGVELDPEFAARGKNDGDVDGISYFVTSIPGSGIFLPAHRALKRNVAVRTPNNAVQPTTPTNPSYFDLSRTPAAKNRSPGTPSLPKFSQSVGPGARNPFSQSISLAGRPSPALKPKGRPSLPRPESPTRRPPLPTSQSTISNGRTSAMGFNSSVRAGRPPVASSPALKKMTQPSTPVRPPSRSQSRIGARSPSHQDTPVVSRSLNGLRTATKPTAAPSVELRRLQQELVERDKQLQSRTDALAEMEAAMQSVQVSSASRAANAPTDESAAEIAQLRTALREKVDKIAALTADFDKHRSEFRSTIETVEMASSETEKVYEKRIEELQVEVSEQQREIGELREQSTDVEIVSQQFKQLEELVQELEEGLEDARRGEAEARAEAEHLRGEVERAKSELQHEKKRVASRSVASDATVEQKDAEIRELEAVIQQLRFEAQPKNNQGERRLEDQLAALKGNLEMLSEQNTELKAQLTTKTAREEALEVDLADLRRLQNSRLHHTPSPSASSISARNTHEQQQHQARGGSPVRRPAPIMTRANQSPVVPAGSSPMRLGLGLGMLNGMRGIESSSARRDSLGASIPSPHSTTADMRKHCDMCDGDGHDAVNCRRHSSAYRDGDDDDDDDEQGLDGIDAELERVHLDTTLSPSPSPSPHTHASEHEQQQQQQPVYDPTGTGPAPGKRTRRIDMTKWCALCERDGHESVDCPFEEEW